MKFILSSTSGRIYDIPTTTETITKVVKDRRGNEWNVERTENICEVNSIEDLMNMVDEINKETGKDYGRIIVSRSWSNEGYWEMEIYDEYRE